MSKLHQHSNFLKRLSKAKNYRERRELVQRASCDQLKTIPSLVYNILRGQITLPRKSLARRHTLINQKKLGRFVNSCCTPTVKSPKNRVHIKPAGVQYVREQLQQQRGGVFPLLFPLIALAGKAALAGAVSAGTGLAVKKIAGY